MARFSQEDKLTIWDMRGSRGPREAHCQASGPAELFAPKVHCRPRREAPDGARAL